jgi:hypothetical protein
VLFILINVTTMATNILKVEKQWCAWLAIKLATIFPPLSGQLMGLPSTTIASRPGAAQELEKRTGF